MMDYKSSDHKTLKHILLFRLSSHRNLDLHILFHISGITAGTLKVENLIAYHLSTFQDLEKISGNRFLSHISA